MIETLILVAVICKLQTRLDCTMATNNIIKEVAAWPR